ncbi:MAG: sulfotransferase [bacterium]
MHHHVKIKYAKDKYFNFKLEIGRRFVGNTRHSFNKDYNKVFCIGFHKTGTSSLAAALRKFGFKMGNQTVGEMLATDYFRKDYDRIIAFCESAEAFQDTPFAFPELFKELDKSFPKSKFILTIRDTPEQWFNSLVRFHTKKYSSDKQNPPTEKDLANAIYRYKGLPLETKKAYNWPETPLYEKYNYLKFYNKHINDVTSYFSHRPNDLLILNVAQPGSYKQLADFLNVPGVKEGERFPWLNKT